MKHFSLLTSTILLGSILFVSCNNSDKGDSTNEKESQPAFNLTMAKKGIQESTNKFIESLSKLDSVTAASYYTTDAKFMDANLKSFVGRENIISEISTFMKAGFTKLDVKTIDLWGCGDYVTEEEQWTISNGKMTDVGKSLVLWKNENGTWKMFRDMLSSDLPAIPSK